MKVAIICLYLLTVVYICSSIHNNTAFFQSYVKTMETEHNNYF